MKSIRSSRFILVLSLTAILSCASIQKQRCNPGYANNLGYQDAGFGDAAQSSMTLGNVCVGYTDYPYELFQRDYLTGFQRRKQEVCNTAYISQRAQSDAIALRIDQPGLAAIRICVDTPTNTTELQSTYQSVYTKHFCLPHIFSQMGEKTATAFSHPSYQTALALCHGALQGSLTMAFTDAYQRVMDQQCQANNVYSMAMQDARTERNIQEGINRLKLCSDKLQVQAISIYSQAYNDESTRRIRQEEQQRREAELEALRLQNLALLSRSAITASQILYRDHPLTTSCQLDLSSGKAIVSVTNPLNRSISISERWQIEFFGNGGEFLDQDSTFEVVMLFGNETDNFRMSIPYSLRGRAILCRATPNIPPPSSTGAGAAPAPQPTRSALSTTYITYRDNPLTTACQLDFSAGKAIVHVTNSSSRSVNISERWQVDFFGAQGEFLEQETAWQSVMLFPNDAESFRISIPYGVRGRTTLCRARLQLPPPSASPSQAAPPPSSRPSSGGMGTGGAGGSAGRPGVAPPPERQ